MTKTPRTDASKDKFLALRESGYDGGIDQDGNPVDPTSREAEILDALRRRGAGT
jgi:hypothetical protein